MTETESRHYRGWTSTYHAALRELGMEATPSPKPRWQPPAASLPAAPTEADLARSERLAQRAAQRSQVMTPTLTAALDDPRCFAGSFDAMSWDVWRVFLKALEALPMDEAEMAL